jgi:hypothetical protein
MLSLTTVVVRRVFSLSFLPWMLLLLAVLLSVPIVSFVESSRRKKELAALQEQSAEPGLEGEDGMMVADDGTGLAEDGGFGDGGFGDGGFGDGGLGDDTFK